MKLVARLDPKRFLFAVVVLAVVVPAAIWSPEIIAILVTALLAYGGFRFVIGPLPRLIARLRLSLSWKVLGAIGLIAAVAIGASVVNITAMEHMHDQLHQVQDMWRFNPRSAIVVINNLESDQHGFFFSMMPFLSVMAAVLALGLGLAVALAVIGPLRQMGQSMRLIAAGHFSQKVKVNNRDELGELAQRINQTSTDLARLHEATLAAERARALEERVTQVTLAQEEERRRISRELHDGLGPSLAYITNRLRTCQRLVHSDPTSAEEELGELTVLLRGHIQDIRELIYDLRPLPLDQLGLMDALRQQTERFSRLTGVHVAFSAQEKTSLDPLVEVTLYRVLQESLANIQKHTNATEVEVSLPVQDAGVELRVKDNGQGFNPNAYPYSGPSASGIGLLSMRERAELIGGTLSVHSSPGQGCEVVLFVPAREVTLGANSGAASRRPYPVPQGDQHYPGADDWR